MVYIHTAVLANTQPTVYAYLMKQVVVRAISYFVIVFVILSNAYIVIPPSGVNTCFNERREGRKKEASKVKQCT